MRIGFDGTCLANRRGFGRFARLLLEALAQASHPHRLVVVIDRPSEPRVAIPPACDRLVVDLAEAPSSAASARGQRRFRDLIALGRAVARARLDLIYFPATYTFFPVWNVPRVVVTMHDALAVAHPELVFPTRRGRLAWLVKELVAARTADRIVTVSQASQRDLQAWFRIPERKLRVIGEGPHPIFRPAAADPRGVEVLANYGLPADRPYLIYVGGLSPHKNLPRLIEAVARAAVPELRLVVVGDFHDVFHTEADVIRAAIGRNRLQDRVVLTGYVPDDDLVHLYSRSLALVLPSLLEGFGLPAVEAMACGVPVLASRVGSLPEVVGDAGLLFDPHDPAAIAQAIGRLANSPAIRNTLATRALARSASFSWTAAAAELLACFDELAPPRQPRIPRRSSVRTAPHPPQNSPLIPSM